MKINGIHHVTAITSNAKKIYEFFTLILGMRLVKKTVNQDDIYTYHLFFADDLGSPGTDMTFFDFPNVSKAIKGTNEIAKTGFRVPNHEALIYWKKRFEKYNVKHDNIQKLFGIESLAFRDFDEQNYILFSDEGQDGVKPGVPWKNGPVPDEFAIIGLGPMFLKINDQKKIQNVLIDFLGFKLIEVNKNLSLYQCSPGGLGASLIVEYEPNLGISIQGYGSVHHLAFRVDDKKEIEAWIDYLNSSHIRHSGYINRFYFESLYTKLYPGILFEFATEGPGFIDDEEDYNHLGETLTLPPKLRNSRAMIEKLIKPIETKSKQLKSKKEYL